MALEKYYIVNEKVLPNIFIKVIKAKELILSKQVKDISEGVKSVGISRSAYYKYKDYIFNMEKEVNSKKITLFILLNHKQGILCNILDVIAENNGNILTINQDIPINMNANVTVTIDICKMKITVKNLIEQLSKLLMVVNVQLIAME